MARAPAGASGRGSQAGVAPVLSVLRLDVPTTRPRHFVTETDDLADALDAAQQRWPALSRAQLVVRLALEGHRADELARDERRTRRLEAIRRHSGALTGTYGPQYLKRAREEWPP